MTAARQTPRAATLGLVLEELARAKVVRAVHRSWFEPPFDGQWIARLDSRQACADEHAFDCELAAMPPMFHPTIRAGRIYSHGSFASKDGLVYADTSRATTPGWSRVEVDRWSPLVDAMTGRLTGCIVRTETRTIGQVSAAIAIAIGHVERTGDAIEAAHDAGDYESPDVWPFTACESFSIAWWGEPSSPPSRVSFADSQWPVDARIACYAVRGGSEGWYVHVDAIERAEHSRAATIRPLIQVKTFEGPLTAHAIVAAISEALGVCS